MYDVMHLPGVIEIGKTGENLFRKIEFDLRPWLAEMPDGVGSIVHVRPGETGDDAYVAATTMEDGILTWILSAGDIGEVEGYGQMEVWLEDTNEKRGKSAKCQTFVRSSLAPTSETPPEAQEAWLEQMTGLKTETVNAAQSAEDAREAAESAQTAAEAARDAAQAVAGDFQGLSATASGLAAGTSPTVNVTHDEGGLFNLAFGIPKGDKGDQGDPPTDSQVQTAANNYLSQVITNPDSPPLDRALSSNAAAAPADMVGDLKSALRATVDTIEGGYVDIFPYHNEWVNGYFNASGELVSNNNNISPTNSPFVAEAGKNYKIIPNGLTANIFEYTYSGGVYTRTKVTTFTDIRIISYNSDTYISIHFGGWTYGTDLVKITSKVEKITGTQETLDNAVQNINVIESHVDLLEENVLSRFETGILPIFQPTTSWALCYFDAAGIPQYNNKNASPTSAPFLCKKNETLYIDAAEYTGNYTIYSRSGNTFTRLSVETFTGLKEIHFYVDTYVTLHFSSSSNIDLSTLDIAISHDIGLILKINSIKNYAKTLENAFFPSGDYNYYYSKYGKLPEGAMSVSQIPNGVRFAVRGFSDPDYTNKTYDSGWKTSQLNIATDGNTYYDIYATDATGAQILDFDILNDFIVEIIVPISNQVLQNQDTAIKIENNGVYKNAIIRSIAHRGDSITAPENTAPAYILAKKHGMNAVENDIFKTSDGVYMCWHDDTLSKCGNLLDINGYLMYTDGATFYYYNALTDSLYTWNGNSYVASAESIENLTRCAGNNYTVANMTSAVLKRIDVGIYKGIKYQGTQMLTMAEWVLLCKQLGVDIYIDTKIPHTQQIIDDWLSIIDTYGMRDHTSWLSVFIPLTGYLKEKDPNARIGLLVVPTQELVEAYSSFNTGRGVFFNGSIDDVTSANTKLGITNGFEVECWYANNGSTQATTFSKIRNAVNCGVNGITMDHYRIDEAFSDLFG